jgi:hypothetical protein
MGLCLEVAPKGKSKVVKRPHLQPTASEKLIAGVRHILGKQVLRVRFPNSRLDTPSLSATSASTVIGPFGFGAGKTAFFHNLARRRRPGTRVCLSFDSGSPTHPESKQLRWRLYIPPNEVRTREADPILPDRGSRPCEVACSLHRSQILRDF